MSYIKFYTNKANVKDIENHLYQCSDLFDPILTSYVNIKGYSLKIRNNADTFEAWSDKKLIGLVACYLNNFETRCGYITNVSVIKEHQGFGIAAKLISNLIEKALKLGFKSIKLEVDIKNIVAIDLYKRAGFVLNGRLGEKYQMINRLFDSQKALVSICCLTYNHANFIRQTIESFLMQKTNFPIEVLIHDDASTDSTASIIQEYENKYPEIIKPIYQIENQYSKGRLIIATFQIPRAKGKYIAMCEGDDYWTDQNKLQKQVDFLEQFHDYGMICTNYSKYFEKGKIFLKDCFKSSKYKLGVRFEDYLLDMSTIGTATVLFRKELLLNYYNEIPESVRKSFRVGDSPKYLYISASSKIAVLPEETAVYRIHDNTACHISDQEEYYAFLQNGLLIADYFYKKYTAGDKLLGRKLLIKKLRIDLFHGFRTMNKNISVKAFSELKKHKLNIYHRISTYLYYFGTSGRWQNIIVSFLFRLYRLKNIYRLSK